MDDRRAEANERAQELLWQVDGSEYWHQPENKELLRDLYRLVHKMRKHGGQSKDESVKDILRAIKYKGCNSITDICEETSIVKATVVKIVNELIEAKAAEWRPRQSLRPGPKRMDIYLTGRPFGDIVP